MDIQEFAKQLSDATKDMSEEQRANVRAHGPSFRVRLRQARAS